MKVVFICGSLEPGYDGVGDYTRLLALEVIKQGHQAFIIAINDQFIPDVMDYSQYLDIDSVPVLRLSSTYKNKKRIELARNWIDNINPDWISLQFVIFAFHPKGIPLQFLKALPILGKGRNWHLMFHELWVGVSDIASKKHVIWGAIQQYLIKKLIRRLKPNLITTQCNLYFEHLKTIKPSVYYLPLFSNVPKHSFPVQNHSKPQSVEPIADLNLVVFGTIHPLARIEDLIKEVTRFKHITNKTVCLFLIGRCGGEAMVWSKLWEKASLSVKVLGEQPIEILSKVLSSSHIGVSTSALPMIDKSGTVAAMMEHGLPVICVGQTWVPRGSISPAVPSGVFDVSEGCIEKSLNYVVDKNSSRTLPVVAGNLLSLIDQNTQ